MEKKNAVKNILVVPYSLTTWFYYINDGEKHAVSEKAITTLLSELAPNHVYSIYENMKRSKSFFIDIEKNEFFEVNYDDEEIKNESVKNHNSIDMNQLIEDSEKSLIKGQKEKLSIIEKFAKKSF